MSLVHKVSDLFEYRTYPKNWVTCELMKISVIQNGFPFKSNLFNNNKKGFPLLRIRDIVGSKIDTFYDGDYIEDFVVHNGDLIVGMDGDFNHNLWNNDPSLLNQRVCRIFPHESFINKSFLYYGIGTFLKVINDNTSAVTVKHLSSKSIGEIPFPLPPLAEQERIVAKLDKLFAQHEKIKATLDRIPQLLKNFRLQILTHAVTGKLTEQWREGKELEEWKNLNLIDVILEKPRNGYSPRAVEYATPLKSLSLSATTSGKFDPSFVKYIDEEKPPINSHLWLKNGDILIQRSNSLDYVGTAAIYDGVDSDFIYPDIMMKVRANEFVETKYLYFILSSEITKKYYRENATGTAGNMPKINQDVVSRTPVLLPSLQEQQETVRRVESLFAKTDAIDLRYQSLKAKIESLPQAILHKAFKGELVPQLSTDGDAKDLLAEILALKKEVKGKKK